MSLQAGYLFKERKLYICLAFAGLAVSIAIAWKQLLGFSLPFCTADACDVVLNSRWSVFLGLPLSIWGCLLYAVLLFLNARPAPKTHKYSTFLVTSGFLISAYLLLVSMIEIGAICYYCTISLTIIGALFFYDIYRRKRKNNLTRLAGIFAGGLIILIMQATASDGDLLPKKADPNLVALAKHLTASGAKFYGASWCNHCQTQKKLFGSASSYLPFVECSPRGQQSAQSTECLLNEIKNYPTWVIGGRRFERGFSIEALEKISGFRHVSQGGE
ncbi:MAG: vitamin K epoxide reductase family protein [Pseudomonadota bacterium]|nr:vitamin K epoxide reductase family protein [Pseudomonadota bacterium]